MFVLCEGKRREEKGGHGGKENMIWMQRIDRRRGKGRKEREREGGIEGGRNEKGTHPGNKRRMKGRDKKKGYRKKKSDMGRRE